MFYRFGFEHEIYRSLNQIPLHLRMKLDLTGIKMSLKAWLAFSLEERWVLCHLAIETEEERKNFVSYLGFLSRRDLGDEAIVARPMTCPPWEDQSCIPESVKARSREVGQEVTIEEWDQWSLYERYALFKLSISKNGPEQFHKALREFRARVGNSS